MAQTKVFIHCFSAPLLWDISTENPKNYPYWEELVSLMKQKENWDIIQLKKNNEKQVGNLPCYTDLSIRELTERVKDEMDFFVSVDSFLPHMAHYYEKVGFVIFGQSDPEIFGYKEHFNILKSREYLRERQFWYWAQTPYKAEVFPTPEEVFQIITNYIP